MNNLVSESVCQLCGGVNPVWFTTNELWNEVIGDRWHFVCPNCFISLAEDKVKDIFPVWRLGAEENAD